MVTGRHCEIGSSLQSSRERLKEVIDKIGRRGSWDPLGREGMCGCGEDKKGTGVMGKGENHDRGPGGIPEVAVDARVESINWLRRETRDEGEEVVGEDRTGRRGSSSATRRSREWLKRMEGKAT